MKRFACVLCSAMLSVSLIACGGSGSSSTTPESAEQSTSTEEKSASTEEQSTSKEESSQAKDKSGTAWEDSKVMAVWNGLDTKKGVHLKYSSENESTGVHSDVEAYIKGDKFISMEADTAKGYTSKSGMAVIDGEQMTLFPDDMEAQKLNMQLTVKESDIPALDDVAKGIYMAVNYPQAEERGYTVEKRDVDGVTYNVEVYPAPSQYLTEKAFYFDDKGNLAYYVEGPLSSGSIELGETVYKIETIDDKVNDSVFDLSGYTIKE